MLNPEAIADVGGEGYEEEDRDQDEVEEDDSSFDSSESDDDGSLESLSAAARPGMHWIDDPSRMRLTLDEIEDALAIKTIIESIDEIDNLSDFAYCQLALIKGSNIEAAVKMARHLQIFRQEYNVLDTEADGRRCLRRILQLAPKHFLHYEYEDNTVVFNICQSQFSPDDLTTPEKMNDFIVGSYYIHHTWCLDFETIREGVCVNIDCHSYHWKKHLGHKLIRRVWDDFQRSYPFKVKSLKFFHAGLMFNMMFSMVKKTCPSEWLGGARSCEAPGFLDEMFLQPTVEAANERLLAAWDGALRRRYENESACSLDAFKALLPSARELEAVEEEG